MVEILNKPVSGEKNKKEVYSEKKKKARCAAFYKLSTKSEWDLFPQLFQDEKQAKLKLDLMLRPEKIYTIKLDLPE